MGMSEMSLWLFCASIVQSDGIRRHARAVVAGQTACVAGKTECWACSLNT